MKNKFIPLLVAGTALIAACDQKATDNTQSATATTSSAAPIVQKADAIAVVNGKYIAKSTLETLEKEIAERSQGQTFPKEKLVEELVQRELLIQDAVQKQLDKSPEVVAQLEDAKKAILTQADVKNFIKTNPVTDAEIKAEYDAKVGGANATEYKARHILVKTEAEAKKLIAELDKGADFAKLANKNSIDAKESQNGGDLGWFVSSQMVAPFSEAVAKLEKGKYTKAPVQTQFGWHVILREDSRAQTPPPLDSVKEQLTPFLQRKKVQTMVENLRKQAKVEILIPLTEEKPKAAENAAPAAAATPAAQPATEEKAAGEKPAEAAKAAEQAPAAEEVIEAEEVTEEPKEAAKEPEKAATPAPAKEKK